MQTLLQVLDILLPVFYALIFAIYTWEFWREEAPERSMARNALYALLVVHGAYWGVRWIEFGYFPLGSKPEFYSWVAFSVAVAYAFVERQLNQSRTGAFFVGIGVVFQSLAAVFMEYNEKHPLLLENPVYAVHAIFMIFGVTALALGALYALMYIILSRQLKARDLGVFFKRLPPLASLDRMSRLGTVAGSVCLGLALFIGYLLAFTMPGYDYLDPKYVMTTTIWLGYVLAIVFVRFRGLPSLKVAYASLAWFALFLVSVGVAGHSFQQ